MMKLEQGFRVILGVHNFLAIGKLIAFLILFRHSTFCLKYEIENFWFETANSLQSLKTCYLFSEHHFFKNAPFHFKNNFLSKFWCFSLVFSIIATRMAP